MKIFFWQNIISPHQLPYISEICALRKEWEIFLIANDSITNDLKESGWVVESNPNVKILVKPPKKVMFEFIKNDKSVHCFSGINVYPRISDMFKICIKTNSKILVISEVPDMRGMFKILSRNLASIFLERRYKKYIDGVLAISNKVINWYSKFGYDENKLFHFIYCVKKVNYTPEIIMGNKDDRIFRILFVGQLIKRKGLDLLINSLSCLKETGWSLDVFGIGREEKKMKELTIFCGINPKISFHKSISNNELRNIYPKYDLLVLPSLHDGWGAVINEALMAGTPVLCSDQCGAADLISNELLGSTFQSGSVEALTQKLSERIKAGKVTYENRKSIMQWSERIEGRIVAKYFVDIIDYLDKRILAKPNVPWLN